MPYECLRIKPFTTRGTDMNIAEVLKLQHNIKTIIHHAQSPDLNLIEACWDIVEPRVRKRTWRRLPELREIIQDEWSKVTMSAIQKRIDEMPSRCHKLVNSHGGAFKSRLW
jgi:hypothetical protein